MSKEGKPLGGAPAFDPVACTEHLGNGGVYECCVLLAAFGIFEFNYPANPPMVGSILRVRNQLVPMVRTGSLYNRGWQPQSLLVRVASPPVLVKLVPLMSGELRVALALVWADAVRDGDQAAATVYEDVNQGKV